MRVASCALLVVLVLVSLTGFFLIGKGIGGILRPERDYVPIRITHVRVDSVGERGGGVQVVSELPGEYGCVINANKCNCDSPYGRVEFPAFVECDVVRFALYQREKEK